MDANNLNEWVVENMDEYSDIASKILNYLKCQS